MLSQQLVQKQSQKLVITQDLRQSIELLQLSNLELSSRIQNELLENPLLDDVSENQTSPELADGPTQEKSDSVQRTEKEEGDSSWTDSSDYRTLSAPGDSEKTERKHQFLENGISSRESLADHLLWQLRLSSLDSDEIEAGEFIISAIDEKGFLTDPLEELIEGTDLKLEHARTALAQIQAFDPVGCGTHGVQETLLVQAQILHNDDEVLARLLRDHFVDIEKLDYRKIEKQTGLGREEIEQAIGIIRTLEPYPGTLHSTRQPDYVIPDLIVLESDGEMRVIINDDWLPNLRVNESYKNVASGRGASAADRDYVQTKLNSAMWLIKSVKQRRQTLYRVMEAILGFQEEFFRKGHGHLQPLTLRDVAEKVELHESTVSRITTNKYVQTRWGVFELKYFFSSALKSSRGGEDRTSAKNIQDRIKQIVAEEDPSAPLSDQDIMEIIQGEGVKIARRTVAKYRKILRILPADRRRKLNQLKSREGENPSRKRE